MKKVTNILLANQTGIRIGILAIVTLIAALALAVEFFKATGDDRYFMAHEDETIYHGSAAVFAATGSCQAESCIEEKVSKVGQYNWYGPGYSVIYGTVRYLGGPAHSLFIRFNFALAVSILALILVLRLSWEQRLLMTSVLLVSQLFTGYLFSYFPEMLHLFFGTVLSVWLWKHWDNPDRKWVIVFVALTLLFTLCRITTIFWLAVLLPASRTRREWIVHSLVFTGGVGLAMIYMRFCLAPAYAPEMFKLDELFRGELLSFIGHTVGALADNVVRLFSGDQSAVYLQLALWVIAIVVALRTRDRFILGAVLVTIVLYGVMMAYYTVAPFFLMKQTSMLFPLLLLAVVKSNVRWATWTTWLMFMALWVSANKDRADLIKEHRDAYDHYESFAELRSDFNRIPDAIGPTRSHVILWCYNEFEFGTTAQALMPYADNKGNPIMYTTNIADPSAAPETKFVLHGRLPVDYVLSRDALQGTAWAEVLKTPSFTLYKIN